MPVNIKLKKGFDIRISGHAELVLSGVSDPVKFAVKPVDFPNLTPKVLVKAGDQVKAGSPLFCDKARPDILFTSPVSGTVTSIDRGDRRRLLEIVVDRSGNESFDFGKVDPAALTAGEITSRLLASGLWPSIRQRPYNVIANPGDKPKAIFISGFDTSPLAPDYNFIMENVNAEYYYKGINALSKLTEGKLHLILNGASKTNSTLGATPKAELSFFSGPHPAGNSGVHIHHIDPVNKGEVVWMCGIQDIVNIGRLFAEGIYKPEKVIALTGSEVIKPAYYKVLSGSSIDRMVEGNVKSGNNRYISGNVLTGSKIESNGYLGYYDSQVTVIPEGDYHEFFGWATPGISKLSFYNIFLSRLFPRKALKPDTNYHGGVRAFVMTGQYEKVVPMDIYPMQLFKAILAGDIEKMENLGIYEIAEEDVALCEFICPSKIEIQSIVRSGLDMMVKEMD